MEVAKQQALQAIESRFSSELLEMILSGAARAAEVPERLRAFGIDPSGPLAVITMIVGEGRVRPTGSTDEIERFFGERGIPLVLVAGSQDTVAVFPWNTEPRGLVALAEHLVEAIAKRYPKDRTVIGIGELAAHSSALREPLIRSREACHVLQRRSRDSRVATFADVSTHRMLLGLHDRDVLRRFADDILGPLRSHDEQNGTELERTLRMFLGNDGHWSTTASELYIHVNTLRNRIARITDLTGRDVTRLEDRVDLFLALEADGSELIGVHVGVGGRPGQGARLNLLVRAHGIGDVTASGEPHVAALQCVLDESPQRHDPAGPTRKERVHTEIEQAPVAAHTVQLGAPHLGHLDRRLDHRADVRLWQICVLLPVVERPMHGQLHDRRCVGSDFVRPVIAHQRRVVVQPILGDQARRLPTGTPQRGAMTTDLDALRRENVHGTLEISPLLRGGHRHR